MQLLTTSGWKDYELIDSGNEMRYERFGPYKTVRPDPQAIWQPSLKDWSDADVQFISTGAGKGIWQFKRHLPEKWLMHWRHLAFWTRLTSFKHTGVFPEQNIQWEYIEKKIKQFRSAPTILNLFGYTGIASLVAAAGGAHVTHIDASKPSLSWAKENQVVAKLQDKPMRFMLDDAVKFVEREIRRGNTYNGILLDPPVYGHGPAGQIWKFSEDFPRLLRLCNQLLAKQPLFVIVNAYAISSSSLMLENVMHDTLPKGNIIVGELALQESSSKRLLSTGIFGRWEGLLP
ncbi:MAG TPA: class I SAM-dependent methyltransferase [Patescibacteria group bacterium]|nr:class I SAM-dependent methyltransferase [Patescibacteria group bacterium]